MRVIAALNKGIVFLLEIVMIVSCAYFGFQKGTNIYAKWMLAIILPALAILLWGYYAAPKSSHRLSMPHLAVFRALMFLAAACCLYRCNKISAAISLAVLSFATQFLSCCYGDKIKLVFLSGTFSDHPVYRK
jgi:hypothetical protein